MNWLSTLFKNSGLNIISSVGKVIDDLVTSDEEMALTQNQKLKIETAYRVKMEELLSKLDKQQAEHEEQLEEEVTSRLKLDMKSDSWLSKNVRPMALIFMTVVVTGLAIATLFSNRFVEQELETLKVWMDFFKTIMVIIYGFYFGSRGIEKIQKIRAHGKTQEAKAKAGDTPFDQRPRG